MSNRSQIPSNELIAILKSTPDCYLVLNPTFEVIEASDVFLKSIMAKREEVIGHSIFDLFTSNPKSSSIISLKTSLERILKFKSVDRVSLQRFEINRPSIFKNSFDERYWSILNSPVINEAGELKYIIAKIEDATEFVNLKKSHAKYTAGKNKNVIIDVSKNGKKIHCDTLTGLSSYQSLVDEIKKSADDSKENQKKFAILFLDLDRFKLINDTLGYKTGDVLLQTIAKRLLASFQSCDVITRLTGDKFLILLKEISNTTDLAGIAKRILQKIKEPILIENNKLFISGSIGISVYPESGKNEEELIKHAGIAMYYAKQLGRNTYQYCTAKMIDEVRNKMDIENDLRKSLSEKNFVLYYQPQIDVKSGMITGVEVLLRLPREDGGLLLPREFISIAEETGLIIPMEEWVLEHACHQYQQWESNIFKNLSEKEIPIRLGINISYQHFTHPSLPNKLKSIFKKYKIIPKNIELEITENCLLDDAEGVEKIITQLKELGVHFALDDFGLGYSSLSYIKQFHIDTLKIDPSLIKNVLLDQTDAEIISYIVSIAHTMQIQVIAEGIETKEQTKFLVDHHVDKIQGNYFSKPLSADEMTAFLLENKDWKVQDIL